MIRPIDIRLNAAHPELPLAEAVTFTGSPSTVLIRGVPPNCGRWAITAVSVAATFPDGSTTTRAAVQSANGVWVATLPATATSGRTANGLRVMADGIDENGAAVTGYILGVADFAVASLDVTPAPQPGETSYQMLYFDNVPSVLHKGDVAKIDGVLKFYNGMAWEPFAAPVTFDNAVTKDSANGVKSSGIWAAIWGALAALPTGFSSLYDWCVSQLAGKASKADATLTERGPNHDGFSEWIFTPGEFNADTIKMKYEYGGWQPYTDSYGNLGRRQGDAESTMLTWVEGVDFAIGFTATRTALSGYQLGSQSDKPLASEAEAEALRQGKQDALSAQQLANIAAVPDKLDKSGGEMTGILREKHGLILGKEGVDEFDGFKVDANGQATMTNHAGGSATLGEIITAVQEVPNKANRAANPTAGNLAALDANGNPTDSTIPAANVATKANIPYDIGTPIVIDTASSETVEGETVYYGAATLADRTSNIVQVTAATALDELRITFPAATSGKVRDFGLRVEIGTGSAALTAPALVPIAPTGGTIKIENADRTIPELADGTATAKGVTLLYFSENAPGVFVVKGEQVEEVA